MRPNGRRLERGDPRERVHDRLHGRGVERVRRALQRRLRAADLGGFKVAYRSSAGTSDITLATIPAGTTIPAGGFYLLAGRGYPGSHAADQSFSTSLAATGGGLAVRDTGGAILDSVGYGDTTNAFVEAHPATAPPATAAPGSSSGRIPDGHDTNDNSADFSVSATPSPGAANH